MEVREFFDSVYSRYERYWWRNPNRYSLDPNDHASSLVTANLLDLLAVRKPGRALDLGGGEGADAIRLAMTGYDVDVVELSEVGSQKIEDFAKDSGVKINVINADACAYPGYGTYDLVICNGLLHYVEDKDSILTKIQDMTAQGGINAVSLFSDYTPIPRCHQIVPVYPDAEDGIVMRFYKDWRTRGLWFDRNRPERSHPGFGPHIHSFIKMISQKE